MEFIVGGLAVLVFVDLLLTFGVIRRLREHGDSLSGLRQVLSGPSSLQPGAKVADFAEMEALNGRKVSIAWLSGSTSLVAFHSTACGVCEQDRRTLVDYLHEVPGRGMQALVVIVRLEPREGATDQVKELASTVPEATLVLEEPPAGVVQTAFQVSAYPSYFMVGPDGTVLASAHRVAELSRDMPSAISETAG